MLRRPLIVLVAVLATTSAGAGRSLLQGRRGESPDAIPRPGTSFLDVPLVRQSTDYTCGAAALQSILLYFDHSLDFLEADLAEELDADPEVGIETEDIIATAQELGFRALARENLGLADLEAAIDDLTPVMVLLQAWPGFGIAPDWPNLWDDGHYAVVVGYDDRYIYFMDPSTAGNYTYIPRTEFMKRWHHQDWDRRVQRFGLILTKGRPHYDPKLVYRMN